jgi:hypothetical protein
MERLFIFLVSGGWDGQIAVKEHDRKNFRQHFVSGRSFRGAGGAGHPQAAGIGNGKMLRAEIAEEQP